MAFQGIAPVRFGSVSMVTATLGTNDPEVGTVVEDGDEKYVFVYNNGTTQISVGEGAIVSAVTGYSVTVSSLTHVDTPVGVVKHATLTTGTYGWLLQRGFGPFKTAADVSAATGQPLCLGADGRWVLRGTTTAYSQVVLPTIFGKAVLTADSAATGWAYFRIA